MASTVYKILSVLVVAAVAIGSISYFYAELPKTGNHQVPIKGVSMITPQEINQSIGGSWITQMSGEGGSYLTSSFLQLLETLAYQNLTFENYTFGFTTADFTPFASSDAGMATFKDSGTGSHLVGSYANDQNTSFVTGLYTNLSIAAKGNLTDYSNGTASSGTYFMGWYNQTVNGTLHRVFVDTGEYGSYIVLFTYSSIKSPGSAIDPGMLQLMTDEFGKLPSNAMVYPPYVITPDQMSSDIGLGLDMYGYIGFNFSAFGTLLGNLYMLGNLSLYSSLINITGYNLSLYLNPSTFGYLNNITSVSIVEGVNTTTNQSIAVGNIGALDDTASLIWAGVPFAIANDPSLNSNVTIHSINGTMYNITYNSDKNVSVTFALDGGYVIFVLDTDYGTTLLSQDKINSLVASQETELN